MIKKHTQIKIEVGLDENHIPEEIKWSAEDGNTWDNKSKAMILSLWDDKEKVSLYLNLWIKQMPLEEMKAFYYQVFISMAESYKKASLDEELAMDIENFGKAFIKKAQEKDLKK